jgi:parvulin-like peptidyl-prolyl isomerase
MVTAIAVAGERTVVEAIMVRVNDRILTISDFRARLQQELSQRPEQPDVDELPRFAESLFDAVIDELVILERATEKRLTVDESAIDETIADLREQNNLQDDEAFVAALASSGMTEEDLRERYRQSILMRKTVQAEIQPAEITEQEVRKLYEDEKERFRVPNKVELVQVYFPVDEEGGDRERDGVRRRAQGLAERVNAGSDMAAEATLAGVEVQELGAIPEDDLRPELSESLAELSEGQLTGPLSTAGGYQVIRLVKRIPATYQDFDEVREMLRRQLSMQRYQEQSNGLVNKLRQEFLVEIHRELLDRALIGLDHG